MARIYTTPESEAKAKAFLHDITYAAGLHTNNIRPTSCWYLSDHSFATAASTLCDELVNRDFNNVDNAMWDLSHYKIILPLNGYSRRVQFKPEHIAKCIVYMAEQLNIYWDDTIRTHYEVEEFKKTTLGEAVYKYGRVISEIKDTSKRSARKTSSSKTDPNQPKNTYKQSGPQSGNVRDLIGQPGEKVIATGELIYKIIGDDPNIKNTPNVFINPISASGASGKTNKVKIGSGNGYTDCTCFFDDPNLAQDFLDKINAAGIVPSNVTNLRVVKMKADPNGYFLVGTEFGDCAISAKKLNEALVEECNKINTCNGRPCSWEKATENYSKEELDELHNWMRRD